MNRAVIIHILDTSGSMDQPQRKLADTEAKAVEAWLQARRSDVVIRLVAFHGTAREVDRRDFSDVTESGATIISAGLVRCAEILEADHPPAEWDAFAVLFTDGDNWSYEDTVKCMRLVRDRLLPGLVAFGYAQLEAPYGQGQFIHDVNEAFGADRRVVSRLLGKERGFAALFCERLESLGIVAQAAPKREPAAPRKKPARGK